MTEPLPLRQALRIVVITDSRLCAPRDLIETVGLTLRAGCRCIQLRDKGANARELFAQARALRALTDEFEALLIVNDRFDVALASQADGVHVGPHDPPVGAIRSHVPDSFIIGASCDQVAEAVALEAAGADYLGCGTVYATETKADAGEPIGVEGLGRLVQSVDLPVVAIGGITTPRAADLHATGIAGVAVVGAVMAAEDPAVATRDILQAMRLVSG